MMTEKEKIENQIKNLQEQLKQLEELEKEPEMLLMRQGKVDVVDYDKTTYYRIEYTGTFVGVFKWYERQKDFSNLMPILSGGEVLEEYYQKEVIKQKQEYPYKKYTPEETEQSLKQAFREAVKQGVVSSPTEPRTLYQIIEDWWSDVFSNNKEMELCIDDLVNKIDKEFIPPSSKTNSYEWEKCLKVMRDNLRDTC